MDNPQMFADYILGKLQTHGDIANLSSTESAQALLYEDIFTHIEQLAVECTDLPHLHVSGKKADTINRKIILLFRYTIKDCLVVFMEGCTLH
jgi:hypothetical protein